jgi:predicted DNA-binding protein
MTSRVNARLDPALATKLAELQQRTGLGTSALIQVALERYYESMRDAGGPAELLRDFVGCADGARNLSTTYKADLGHLLEKKG